MSLPLVVFEYLGWQYGEGMQEYLRMWRNIHWVMYRLFSIPLLLKTFFAPFRRTSESYGKGFDPKRYAETLVINLVTRLVGATVRGVLLFIAIAFQAIIAIVGVLLFVFFILTPVIIPLGFIIGLITMVV
jgi:fatty acid desaturase